MPFLNHRLRTLQTESFRNLGAAFSPSLFLFLSLNFVPKYLKISFLPLCIYKNGEKNRAKTGHFLLQFLPSNHNILWFNMPIFLISHNTASELPTQHVLSLTKEHTPFNSSAIWEHNSLVLSPIFLDLSKRSFAFPISFFNPVLYMKVIL